MKLPVKYGVSYVMDKDWYPVKWTQEQAQRYADKLADKENKKLNRMPWCGCIGLDFDGKVDELVK
jgi:hypothetical protein